MNITVKQLTAFRAVAASRSFTQAGRALNVAQPVLSAHVRELEESLGARLFDRTTRSVELTAAGEEFLAATEDIIPRLEKAAERVRDLAQRQRGRLRIAAPPLLCASLLPQAMATFRSAYPLLDLSLIDVPTEAIVEKLLRHEADLAVATITNDDERFARSVLLRDHLMLFSAPDRPLPDETVGWQELTAMPLIMLAPGSGIRSLTDRAAASAGVLLQPSLEVMQVMTAIALVQAGLGVAILPSYAMHAVEPGALGSLRATPIVNPSIRREIAIVHLRGRSLSAAGLAFVEILRDRVSRG